ncbi:MAG: Gfo/Idh/MocA family protein, partial [Nanoarchaeota archaeon]
MEKIRIGVLGCANIAERLVIPTIREMDEFELIAVSSRKTSKEKLKKFSLKFDCKGVIGYKNLLERKDLEAVYIPLPPSLHKEWTIKAFEAGKHVLVEKPSSINLESTKLMLKKAKEKNKVLMENYMFEYHSQFKYVKQILKDEVGDIRNLRASFGIPLMNRNNFRYKKDLGGGVLLDAGGYPVKACQMFLGDDIEVKAANLNYVDGFEVDMYGSASLKSVHGITGQISFGFDNYYQCNIELWGNKGKITFKRAFTAPPNVKSKII